MKLRKTKGRRKRERWENIEGRKSLGVYAGNICETSVSGKKVFQEQSTTSHDGRKTKL
jgi:hypothetical protein